MRRARSTAGAGFTLLEIALSLVLLAIVVNQAFAALRAASRASTSDMNGAVLEDQARRVLRQIGYAVMGSNRESLDPAREAPLTSEDVRYQVHLGIQDGAVVWSDPEMVGLKNEVQVFWSQNPDEEDARKVVWTSLVAPFLEGEIPNGMDDNGNGLIDEKGLSFVVDGNAVTIRMSLERVGSDGEVITQTVSTTVTCRNLGDDDE